MKKVLKGIIIAIIVGLVAYLLYLRRPSETAGRAMAFEKVNSWIRVLLVVPLALYAGLFLNEITSIGSTAWLLFGVIFASCLLHGIIEAIFQFDIKALISKKKQLLFTILFCLAFVFVFWTDVFQFDNYVPNEKDIKTIKIDTYLLDHNGKYFDEWEFNQALSFIATNPLVAKLKFQRYLKKYPKDYSAYIYYTVPLITLGEFKEAEKILETLIILIDNDNSYHFEDYFPDCRGNNCSFKSEK